MKYCLTESKAIRLEKRKKDRLSAKFKMFLTVFTMFLIPVLAVVLFYLSKNWYQLSTIFSYQMLEIIKYTTFVLMVMNFLFVSYMLYLALFKYKEVAVPKDELLPSCVVIVPAYNEGKHVLHSLESVLACDYPAEKLEIISIDDGSVDDTWDYIKAIADKSNGRITTIKQSVNQGKRAAILAGVKYSKSDIIVTIDSDSVIAKDALKKLVAPYVNNPKIGGVAGNIKVLNIEEGLMPKMLEGHFLFNSDLHRVAQSTYGAVFCSPGALSSFRRSVVINFIEQWATQTFMGRLANIGEDRAMNNFIHEAGYDIVVQKNAIVYTIVPTNYVDLCKMLIRWIRGDVRENITMTKFVFTRFNIHDKKLLFLQLVLFMQLGGMCLVFFTLAIYLYCIVATLGIFLFSALPFTLILTLLPAFMYWKRCKNSNALVAYIYSVFYVSTLFWLAPYAILSIHRSAWLTRNRLPLTK